MKRTARAPRFVPGGERIFQRIYTRLGCEGRPPHFIVEFHPYAGLTHTIRLREDTAHVRLSDLLGRARPAIVEAAAALLLGRLYRRRAPAEMVDAYRRFAHARSTRRRLLQIRRNRARQSQHRSAGTHHDLAPMFDRLNKSYFGNSLPAPRLGWSARAWRSQLGCYDPALDLILINRRLDARYVPAYVVAYVLYHEMLHLKHPIRFARCRRESHSSQFRKEERQFEEYARAIRFLAPRAGRKIR